MSNNNIIVENSINSNMEVDYVTKRDGTLEEVQFDKILRRIKNLSEKLSINPTKLTQKVCSQMYPNIYSLLAHARLRYSPNISILSLIFQLLLFFL